MLSFKFDKNVILKVTKLILDKLQILFLKQLSKVDSDITGA